MDWEFLRRKIPDLSQALDRIPGVYDAMAKLCGERTQFWQGQDSVDITNKVTMACLQQEVEGLVAKFEEIAKKHRVVLEMEDGWGVLTRARGNVIFQTGVGDVCSVPAVLVDILVNRRSFDGEVESHDLWVIFRGRDGTWKVPKSLLVQLRAAGAPGGTK